MLVTIWVLVMLLLVLWVFGAPRKLAPVRASDGAEGMRRNYDHATAPRRHGQGCARPRDLLLSPAGQGAISGTNNPSGIRS